jgi:hypothetical protein
VAIVITCTIIVETCCTKFVWVESTRIMFVRIQRLSLVMTIFTCLHVWWGKRWKTSLYTWAPFSDVIVTMIFWSVSWATMCSFLHVQHNKWIPKSSMVWSHWHHERCTIVGYDISKQIWSATRKWAKDKWNERVLGQANNQALAVGLAQEWRHAHTTSKGAFDRSKVNSHLCNKFNWSCI